jgi:hypothetical protein
VPDTIPNNVPDTIPNNVPDAIPNNVPDAIPNNVPDKTENKLYNKDFYNEYVSIIKRNDISDSVCMGINCLNSLG